MWLTRCSVMTTHVSMSKLIARRRIIFQNSSKIQRDPTYLTVVICEFQQGPVISSPFLVQHTNATAIIDNCFFLGHAQRHPSGLWLQILMSLRNHDIWFHYEITILIANINLLTKSRQLMQITTIMIANINFITKSRYWLQTLICLRNHDNWCSKHELTVDSLKNDNKTFIFAKHKGLKIC